MKTFINMLVVVLLAVVVYFAWRYFRESDPDFEKDEDVSEDTFESDKKKLFSLSGRKEKAGSTRLINMPVLSYKDTNGKWVNVELTKAHTSIGRSEDCDIVIKNSTLSSKHAEIAMKIRKIGAEKKGLRYFVLKNLSKENPVSFLNEEGGNDDWRDIAKQIPLLSSSKNAFYLGTVEMRVSFPKVEHKLSDDPVFETESDQKVKSKDSQTEDVKNDEKPVKDQKENSCDEALSAAEEAKINEELLNEKRKMIRRRPRSGNRI